MRLFKIIRKIPVLSDTFKIFVIVPSKVSMHAFNNTVGIGSRSQNLFGEDIIICLTSSAVAGVKEESNGTLNV